MKIGCVCACVWVSEAKIEVAHANTERELLSIGKANERKQYVQHNRHKRRSICVHYNPLLRIIVGIWIDTDVDKYKIMKWFHIWILRNTNSQIERKRTGGRSVVHADQLIIDCVRTAFYITWRIRIAITPIIYTTYASRSHTHLHTIDICIYVKTIYKVVYSPLKTFLTAAFRCCIECFMAANTEHKLSNSYNEKQMF